MRLTSKLYAQHLGWTFKKHWQVQGQRVVRETGAAIELQKIGVTVKDVQELLNPKKEAPEWKEFVGSFPTAPLENNAHPNWHSKACYMYGNGNVLLEGIPQAQLLTKTIEINEIPDIREMIKETNLPNSVDRSIQNAILASHVFDPEQVQLPKVKIPERPAYNLPRVYGISQERRIFLLINKLIMECEKLSGRSVTARRRLIANVNFKITLPKDDDLIQFTVDAEKMITSSQPLKAINRKYDNSLPDIHPLKPTISIPKQHIYSTETSYPLSKSLECSHPHTVFLHFNKENVGNLHNSAVTSTQFQSRNLVKAFAIAAARAKQLYGDEAFGDLPKPISVQSIQTDGRRFHFGLFQLNTLQLNGSEGTKNYWFHEPSMDLFEKCEYLSGRPILERYNREVFRYIYTFYNKS